MDPPEGSPWSLVLAGTNLVVRIPPDGIKDPRTVAREDSPETLHVARAEAEQLIEVVELQLNQSILGFLTQVIPWDRLVLGPPAPAASLLLSYLSPGETFHLR
jgi:hypothetical protein